MTGFGSAEIESDNFILKVEIRTLNSKFFDLSMKMPKELTVWESEIKSLLENGLKRGKVNFVLDLVSKGDVDVPVNVDEDLFHLYYNLYKKLSVDVGDNNSDLFKEALHSPNVLVPKELSPDEIPFDEVSEVITKSIDTCNSFRKTEGKKLENAVKTSVLQIANALEKVKKIDPERVQNIRERIEQSIKEIESRVKMDQNRFEQELIYYIEKLDITEEKVRLKSHLDHFLETMNESGPLGKKLGFISQEIGREINTIGSKANYASMQREVVNMKEELEKIKEQVLNVL